MVITFVDASGQPPRVGHASLTRYLEQGSYSRPDVKRSNRCVLDLRAMYHIQYLEIRSGIFKYHSVCNIYYYVIVSRTS